MNENKKNNNEEVIELNPGLGEEKGRFTVSGGMKKPKIGAGFWIRTAAFIIDILILMFLMMFFTFIGKEFLLVLGKGSMYLAFAIIYLYFSLLNGPAGKGKTPGKIITGIRVTDENQQTITIGQSFRRALIQLNAIILVVFVIQPFLSNPASLRMQFVYAFPSLLIFSFNISGMIYLAVHPFKRGYHDLFADSYVQNDKEILNLEQMKEKAGESVDLMYRNAKQSAMLFFAAVMIVGIYFSYQSIYTKDAQVVFEKRNQFRDETKIENFEMELYTKSIPKDEKKAKAMEEANKRSIFTKLFGGQEERSNNPEDYKFRFVLNYYTYNRILEDFFTESKFKQKMEDVKSYAKARVEEDLNRQTGELKEKGENEKIREISRLVGSEEIEIKFVKRLDLLLYKYDEELFTTKSDMNLTLPQILIDAKNMPAEAEDGQTSGSLEKAEKNKSEK